MVKLKVCGMRDSSNIQEVLELQPHYMGFIFYEKSPRFVGEQLDADLLLSFPKTTKKVGVFVNANFDSILKNVRKYGLDLVQLHGTELPEFCRSLRSKGVNIIKAFSVDENFKFWQCNNYKQFSDYFLFDTKGTNFGGTGLTFDWSLLNGYDKEKPFFLSGGLDVEHVEKVIELSSLNLHALDVNSKFELEPGIKDIEKLRQFKARLQELKILA